MRAVPIVFVCIINAGTLIRVNLTDKSEEGFELIKAERSQLLAFSIALLCNSNYVVMQVTLLLSGIFFYLIKAKAAGYYS
jgi:hypothetical protein